MAVSDKFSFDLAEVVVSQCWACKHVRPGNVCAAFPGQIPAEIRENRADHRKPWIDPETGEPGDTGITGTDSITFEPSETVIPGALEALYRHLDDLS